MKFWGKRIKNAEVLANALGEDKEKVKALKDGNLEIGGETLDRVLTAIQDEKVEGAIRDSAIWKWIQETDFREKRKEFGYASQKEVAKLIPCDSSIICNLENHKEEFKRLSPKLREIYAFYTNDFNKHIKTPNKSYLEGLTSKDYKIKDITKKNSKNKSLIWKWYTKTDIRALRVSLGYKSIKDVQKQIGVSSSCISDLELKKYKRMNRTIRSAYNFYKNNVREENTAEDIYNWYTSIEDFPSYRRAFGYSLNRFMGALNLSYDQLRTFERHNYKSATEVVRRIYVFYHTESNRLEPVEWEPINNNTFVEATPEVNTEKQGLSLEEPVVLESNPVYNFESRIEKNTFMGRYNNQIEESMNNLDIKPNDYIKGLIEENKRLTEQLIKTNDEAMKQLGALYDKIITKM